MRLILKESQYDRIFNNKKRKLIITESQYNKLLFESVLTDNLGELEVSDAIEVVRGEDRMFFKVVSKNGNEFMMINCDNGVYKNAYFHIKGDSISKNTLVYSLAQNSKIDDKNPWETVGSDIWKKSTFKNVDKFSVHKSNGKAIECNLSAVSDKKFSIDMTTGSVTTGDDEKDDSKEEPESKGKIDSMVAVISTLNQIKSGYKYEISIGDYKENIKKDKNGKIAKNIKDGNVLIHVINRRGKIVDFEVLSVEGESGDIYKHLVGKDSTFIIDKKSVNIDEESKAVFKMFTLDIEIFKDDKDEDGDRAKEDDAITNIMQFVVVGPYDKDKDYKDNEKEGDSEYDESIDNKTLTDEQMKVLINKLVTNNKFLQDAISSKPNHFLELLGIARKKGILPIKDRMGEWYRTVSDMANTSKKFPINEIFISELDRGSFKDKNGGLDSEFFNKDFKVISLKGKSNNNRVTFGTDFNQIIDENETNKYSIILGSEEEDKEEFYIYKVKVYQLSDEDSEDTKDKYLGVGELKILKNVKK